MRHDKDPKGAGNTELAAIHAIKQRRFWVVGLEQERMAPGRDRSGRWGGGGAWEGDGTA